VHACQGVGIYEPGPAKRAQLAPLYAPFPPSFRLLQRTKRCLIGWLRAGVCVVFDRNSDKCCTLKQQKFDYSVRPERLRVYQANSRQVLSRLQFDLIDIF
jgi:hypothetical protein